MTPNHSARKMASSGKRGRGAPRFMLVKLVSELPLPKDGHRCTVAYLGEINGGRHALSFNVKPSKKYLETTDAPAFERSDVTIAVGDTFEFVFFGTAPRGMIPGVAMQVPIPTEFEQGIYKDKDNGEWKLPRPGANFNARNVFVRDAKGSVLTRTYSDEPTFDANSKTYTPTPEAPWGEDVARPLTMRYMPAPDWLDPQYEQKGPAFIAVAPVNLDGSIGVSDYRNVLLNSDGLHYQFLAGDFAKTTEPNKRAQVQLDNEVMAIWKGIFRAVMMKFVIRLIVTWREKAMAEIRSVGRSIAKAQLDYAEIEFMHPRPDATNLIPLTDTMIFDPVTKSSEIATLQWPCDFKNPERTPLFTRHMSMVLASKDVFSPADLAARVGTGEVKAWIAVVTLGSATYSTLDEIRADPAAKVALVLVMDEERTETVFRDRVEKLLFPRASAP